MEKLMNMIKCPECGAEIPLDEESYARIVTQVRTEQFDKEIAAQVKAVKEQQEAKNKTLLMEATNKFQRELGLKEQEITRLQEQTKNLSENQQREMDAVLDQAEMKHQKELAEKDKEITRLQEQAKGAAYAQKQELEAVRDKAEMKRREDLMEKDRQIQKLQAQMDSAEKDKKLAVNNAVHDKEMEIAELQIRVEQQKQSADKDLQTEKEAHRRDVDQLNELVKYYKDMKIRQSTKMLGESLEQHCMTVFRQHRDEFPNAYFDKDNEVVEGTKGDFVFRENADDGIEILSIMFEMKHEADDTAKKHKNEEFLAKLDKDRRKKNCEYAVLVSTLEPDDEVYNEGIVAAYQYDKMFIVRPQFFLTMIRVLRKAALASMDARRELALIQRENLDVQKFDETLLEFKDKFGWNCDQAQKHFQKTIKEINDAIKHLENVRDELEATGKQLGQANNKLQDLTVKKLTKGNIGMQQKFLDAGIAIE